MTTKAKIVEGRSRILHCLAHCGAEQEAVILLDLQNTYLANYGNFLNKEEVRAFFGKGHIKQVFEQFMKDDVVMHINPEETGSLFFQMKRPLAEALAAPPSEIAKKSVPVMAEPKKPVLVPLPVGALPKVRKEIAKRSSSTMSAYTPMMETKKSAKGGAMIGSSTANTTPTTLKMVGKNNNYLDEEEEYGKLEYAPSNVTFVPKAKTAAKSSSNAVVVKPKQPAGANGLYSDDEDEVEETEMQTEEIDDDYDEEEMEDEGLDEEDEGGDWDGVYNEEKEEEEEEEDKFDNKMEADDRLLKSGKLLGGGQMMAMATAVGKKAAAPEKLASSSSALQPSAVGIFAHSNAEKYPPGVKEAQQQKKQQLPQFQRKEMTKLRKMVSSAMQEEQPENGTKQQGKTSAAAAVKKSALVPKPTQTVAEKKNKFAVPAEISAVSEDESVATFNYEEATTDEMEEEVNGENDSTEIVPEAPKQQKAMVKSGNGMRALIVNSDENTTPNSPIPTSLVASETMATPMPDSFKYKLLAIITNLLYFHRVYLVDELHKMISKSNGFKLEYATFLPTTDALIQFVQCHCYMVKVHKFAAKDELFFVLDADRIEQLDHLQCKVGKSLEAAAANK